MTYSGKVLLTNDDGVNAEGIGDLARVCSSAGFEVVVAAPNYNASGAGTSLIKEHVHMSPIPIQKRTISGVNSDVYGIGCPPAMCVLLSQLGVFEFQPDVVISGINAGLNTGRSVLFSGTVGAALAAQNVGYRGIALSLGKEESKWYYKEAAESSLPVIDAVINGPDRCVVNINVPPRKPEEMKGIRWGCLAPLNSVRNEVARKTEDKVTLQYVHNEYEPSFDSDLGLTRSGYIALTALHGNSEVWSKNVQPNKDFDSSLPIPAVTSGDRLTAARTFTN